MAHQRSKRCLLKIVTFNIGSSSVEKLEWVLQYLAEHDVDIMCLQETKQDTYPSFIYNRGYQVHTRPCTSRSSGGILTFVRDKWRATQPDTLNEEGDTCWSAVSLGEGCRPLVVANTYLRGSLSTEEPTLSLGAISSRLSTLAINKGASKVLVGDLNIDHQRPSDRARHQLLPSSKE